MQLESVTTIKDMLVKAENAEAEQELDAAAQWYEKAIKADPLTEHAYNRLMIIYRKNKSYKQELRVIKEGIKAYEQFYKSRASKSKKIAELSIKLSRSVGLSDKKGNVAYEPEPIGKWKKRKAVVEKKLS
jgi:tetratricopeptide (TPR) repeat protein